MTSVSTIFLSPPPVMNFELSLAISKPQTSQLCKCLQVLIIKFLEGLYKFTLLSSDPVMQYSPDLVNLITQIGPKCRVSSCLASPGNLYSFFINYNILKVNQMKIASDNEQEDSLVQNLTKESKFSPQQAQDRKSIPLKMCNEGREHLANKNYLEASKSFSKAIMGFQFILKENIINKHEAAQILKDSIIPSYSNLSLCHLKLKSYHSVITFATQVLNHQSANVKALFRRGTAYKELKKFQQAIQDFEKMGKMDQNQIQLSNQLINQCKRLIRSEKQKQKAFAKRLIQNYNVQDGQSNQRVQKQGCLSRAKRCIIKYIKKIAFWKK